MQQLQRYQTDEPYNETMGRMIEAKLREITNIADNQFGFRPGKSTTEPIFALRMIQEKYREKNKELHMLFVDLEKVLRSSTQRAIMVEPTKEKSSRSIHSFKIWMKTVKPR